MAKIFVAHENLAIEIINAQGAGVSKDDSADSGGGEREGEGTTEAANPRDQRGGVAEFFLAGFTKTGNVELPLVDGFVLVGEHGWERRRDAGGWYGEDRWPMRKPWVAGLNRIASLRAR